MTDSPPRGDALRADVCVVGAGPAGLALTRWLVGSGLDVLLLEAGPGDPPDGGVDVTSTDNVGLPYSPASTRSSGVGGSSLRWCVETPAGPGFVRLKELDPVDLERSDHSSVSWPLAWSDLLPHYRAARELLGLPAADDDGPVLGELQARTYSFVRKTVFTRDLPATLATNPHVRLLSDCTVTEVVMGPAPDTRVRRLDCVLDGVRRSVQADAYVLAGGAIENARLLLASRSERPTGVGNGADMVGRHFMEHPHYVAGVVLPGQGGGPEATRERWDVVASGGLVTQTKYALSPEVLRERGLLNAAYKVKPYSKVGTLGFGHDGHPGQAAVDAFHRARYAVRVRDPRALALTDLPLLLGAAPALLGFGARRLTGRATPNGSRPVHHGHRLLVMSEQQPSPHSRVSLLAEPDELGVPRAELDWRLTAPDIESMVTGAELVAHALGVVVGGRVVRTLGPEGVPHPAGGAHHMGTTRMSRDPATGVVDENCRVHGTSNLYVAGSSVFPTGGAANPTMTILALVSRLAAHLDRELRSTATVTDGTLP